MTRMTSPTASSPKPCPECGVLIEQSKDFCSDHTPPGELNQKARGARLRNLFRRFDKAALVKHVSNDKVNPVNMLKSVVKELNDDDVVH